MGSYDVTLSRRDTTGATESLASTVKPKLWHIVSKVSNMHKGRHRCKDVGGDLQGGHHGGARKVCLLNLEGDDYRRSMAYQQLVQAWGIVS